MKPYETYQRLEGEPLTERDHQELGSNFWNEGKFNNFVKPLLEEGEEQIFVDMGCNAGLHLKMAEDMGLKAIGVDSNDGAIERGEKWRDKNGGTYRFVKSDMNKCIDDLPVVDYTVFINAHYYFDIVDWLEYLDKLQSKTRFCIIVTTHKNHVNRCWAKADIDSIKRYFKTWTNAGFIDELPLEGEHARRLWGLKFRSPYIEKAKIEDLDSSNHVQDEFWKELDEGKHYKDTKYYYVLKRYRKKWSEEQLHRFIEKKIAIYESIKKDGLKTAIIVDKNNEILDGNHRYAMMRNLGFKYIYIRRV